MTRKQAPFLIIPMLAMMWVSAAAESLYMGNINSVYSKSRFNPLRNPALMSMQMPDSTLGFLVISRAFSKQDVSTDFDIDNVDKEKASTDNKDLLNGSVYLSWSKKFGKSALGIGITSGPDNQYVRRKSSGTITGETTVPEDYLVENKEKITSLNPAIVFSISRSMGENSAFGFQVLTGYSREISESEESQYLDSLLQSRKTGTLTLQTWFAEVRGGYSFREGPVETGFLISSGAVSLQNSEIDYYNSTVLPTDGSAHTRLHFQNRSGASITAGSFINFSPALGLAIEGVYTLPSSYGSKKYNDDIYSVYREDVRTGPFFTFRAGLEYILSPVITLSTGGGCTIVEAFLNHGQESMTSLKIRAFYAGAGVDITLSKKTTLTAGVQMSRISSSSSLQLTLISAEADADEYNLTAILGMSLGF